ncbi:MAG: diguanylate cyclase [Deltaproteobacteria bacterium]|nr:diguanylate cyclase [Deltaproteobacteria bacterium]
MAMLNVTQDDLRGILSQLDQAIYNHNQWYESLLRTLVCHLSYDNRDVEKDSHRKCRFGQWYYDHTSADLKTHPGFMAIETEHKRMHQLAANLLLTEAAGETISLLDYESFNHSVNILRLQLQTLKHELDDLLYNHDPLTRAYSRIGMLTKLRESQELVKRQVETCCIAMMDLDHFKKTNDLYGHLAGDQVLAAVAGFVMAHIRPYDKLFRYGGEEFLISMPQADSKSGFDLIERLRQGIAESKISYEGKELRVTVSFGLTRLDPDVSVEQTIERADRALYAAKSSGRNCTHLWDNSLDSK